MNQHPQGLFYYPLAIPKSLCGRLESFLTDTCEYFSVTPYKWQVFEGDSRKVAHYGYKYNYSSKDVTDTAPEFPDVIEELCVHIYNIHGVNLPDGYWFDQCIINRYLPGEGIGAHYDHAGYDEYIACFTIGGGAEIEFRERCSGNKYALYTEPRSMYVMSGPSRWTWTHEMKKRKKDPGHGLRQTRWSITFRSVRKNN